MPINIRVKGNQETNEYQDALQLKQLFEASLDLNSTDGEILIFANATLFGQETKDVDLIVLGNFERYSCRIKSNAKSSNKEELEEKLRTVFVNNFCFTIETKRHRAEDVKIDGLNILVKYNNKFSDATTQSENQKYSLKKFFADRLNFSPYICNFIWFKNISWESIKGLLGHNDALFTKHNYLPHTFKFPFILQLACVQQPPYNPKEKDGSNYKGYSSFGCLRKNESFDYPKMESVFEIFDKVRVGLGQLTRKKIEHITSKILDEDKKWVKNVGEKLVIISGRAGTGKTIKLLRIACDLAVNNGARSLILTYNHALVSDIKRTLALAEIPDGVDNYTVNITTLHKFIYELVLGFGLEDSKYIPDFIKKYTEYLNELIQCIENGLIQEKEIQDLMKSRHDKVAWDYILIDESQDWSELEKKIIFTIFGKNKTIIADGFDQLIRSQERCNWRQGLKPDKDFYQKSERRGLRQKVNLVSFVNEYAKQAGIVWDIEPKQELIGGKIIISTKGYTQELHNEQLKHCKDCQNSEYEMIFLVPPSLVSRTYHTNKYGDQVEVRKFRQTDEFKRWGISLYDLTDTDLRTQYAVELNQHRLLQYESCRGLEGWTVVCLELDEFIKYKINTFVEVETNELALESFEEKRRKFIYLWSLIPLTRAIDTLVITIKNEKSDVANYLRRTYEKYPDFIQWIN